MDSGDLNASECVGNCLLRLLSLLAAGIKKELQQTYSSAELHRTNSVCQMALDSLRYRSGDRQLLDVTSCKVATRLF
jgi:hypothetical protein